MKTATENICDTLEKVAAIAGIAIIEVYALNLGYDHALLGLGMLAMGGFVVFW